MQHHTGVDGIDVVDAPGNVGQQGTGYEMFQRENPTGESLTR